jgi:hypothetical protein
VSTTAVVAATDNALILMIDVRPLERLGRVVLRGAPAPAVWMGKAARQLIVS